ncbi:MULTISPECIES: RT0821/Lpp0805 family surface protein [unclassified Methylobacterium]|uniref:RT0821/Lpp0805 family surface protein n=1 Tax=unclassified Methylobacterium TaxID=2615210 RepID=UPI001FEEE13F|nr:MULTISPECIES: RT0821/Lpp0805 family surface protein [unclassified Methylobacterium]
MRRCACKEPSRRLRAPVAMTAVSLAMLLCSCSQPLLVFRGEPAAANPPVAEEPVVTGSIEKRPASFGSDLGEEDWRRARAALSVALDPQGNGRPVKWDNPETGLHGAVNPTGLPYVADDLICRNFLASVIGPGRSRFVRGTGCKPSGGHWTLKRVRSAASERS